MATIVDNFMRGQLVERRHKLEHAIDGADDAGRFTRLLGEVDAALARIEDGSYGICESCHDSIEYDRLIADPLVRLCLDHLTDREKSALEQDLQLAAQVQRGLLPNPDFAQDGWRISYHYEPAGLVSGDYCDVVDGGESGLYFMLGDVSGKGVAASMLMAHLHAMFRSLISVELSLKCMLEHASRIFSQSTLPTQYATLVCGRAYSHGRVEICNAGHVRPLVVRGGHVVALEASNLPVGIFSDEEFSVDDLQLDEGDSVVLYSDGISEAMDASGAEYGDDRVIKLIGDHTGRSPSALVAACRADLDGFRGGAGKTDDATMLVLSRAAA
jgi:sigma-B regulation protein RsbU (phosphoserine phosphatase)